MKVFSIYDSKVNSYMRPFYEQHKGYAIRAVTEAVNDKSTAIGKYPADFTLFELGSFDELTGTFDLYSSPVSIGVLLEFVISDS